MVSGGNTHSMRVAKLLLGLDSLSPSETLSPVNGETSPRRGDEASKAGPKGCASLGKGCFSAPRLHNCQSGRTQEMHLKPCQLPSSSVQLTGAQPRARSPLLQAERREAAGPEKRSDLWDQWSWPGKRSDLWDQWRCPGPSRLKQRGDGSALPP